ncbi:hypothetical protein L3V77_07285 [Vibrio sp. DW001]|uniref:hypothetical protein n=1 Tax=unclassified Vibrio TaxID=2614977 RepID=UPI00189EF4E5|nr:MULTISPECIES: hypothetical protein [unclassified Vibrio]UGA56101.1 hypothetical protein IUZ65_007070 [Vibrio sp. VB16]WED28024.1 hypothetical protein L3V77_07285 [Vibrio sp. DW001]
MARFVQVLQLIIAVIVGFFVVKDMILQGIGVFNQQWVMISIVTTLLLELALFVIYKLVEED